MLVCFIFVAAMAIAYITKDQPSQQLIVGAIVGQFSLVVGYFVGSSASSAQKDDKLDTLRTNNPPPQPPP